MNLSQIIKTLVSEIKLTEIQAKIFLHVVINGKMNTSKISNDLKISLDDATQNSKKLTPQLQNSKFYLRTKNKK